MLPNEPRREKTGFFAYAKTKTQISFAVTAKLISAFVFATQIIQSLFFLNPKFQASSYLLWLYSPVCHVCVGPGRKPRRPVFSQRGSNLPTSDHVTTKQRRLRSGLDDAQAALSAGFSYMLFRLFRNLATINVSDFKHFLV